MFDFTLLTFSFHSVGHFNQYHRHPSIVSAFSVIPYKKPIHQLILSDIPSHYI